jgi:hypothetical protein
MVLKSQMEMLEGFIRLWVEQALFGIEREETEGFIRPHQISIKRK